jgi:hypothetical protein
MASIRAATNKGKPIRVRFLWRNVTPNSRQWEQAFSVDGGKTWETNWIPSLLARGIITRKSGQPVPIERCQLSYLLQLNQ